MLAFGTCQAHDTLNMKLRTYVLSKVTFYTIYIAFSTSVISDGIGSGIANEYEINSILKWI